MAAPTITRALADDLAAHPPFDRMPRPVLESLAAASRVRYAEEGEVLFREGDPTAAHFYCLKRGTVELRRRDGGGPDAGGRADATDAADAADAAEVLVDRCEEGDVLGIRPLLAGSDYSATAVAVEDALLHEVPWDRFKVILDAEPAVAAWFAAGFAAELPTRFERLLGRARAAAAPARGGDAAPAIAADENDFRIVEPIRAVATCHPDASVREAAGVMAERNIGSIVVVDEARRPVGILTDSDLRRKVVAPGLDPSATRVSAVMAGPVRTVREGRSVSELIALILAHRVHHFVFTEDGTPASPLSGIASEHDILATQGSHPTVLLEEITRTSDPARLRDLRDRAETLLRSYIEQEVAIEFVCSMMTAINDALVGRALERAMAETAETLGGVPAARGCWLAMGSEGRGEQLLRTDQDNAIVYEDPAPEEEGRTRAFWLETGRRACELLEAFGFARCPADMMASNPQWNRPLSEWTGTFSRWIATPSREATMHANIFFDLRGSHGHLPLAGDLRRHCFAEMDRHRPFITFLAAEALRNPPPLSFFRGFVLEKSGEHAREFDVKARAMMPLADAARVLAYEQRLDVAGGTFARYEALGRAMPEHAGLFEEAAMAYGILVRMRAREGLREGSSGRYLDIERLNKLERQTLRTTFTVIAEVQRMLRLRFQLDAIGR
jgi:CBS domain-containing protein